MPTIRFDFALPPFAVALLACIGIAAAIWFYRFTVPVVSRRLRFFLGFLRAAALALILLLLAQPVLRVTRVSSLRPALAVLLDNSASMRIADAGVRRGDLLRRVVADPVLRRIEERADLRFYAFGTQLLRLPGGEDSLDFGEEGTNLSEALQEIARRKVEDPLNALLIVSDGMATLGRNPQYDADAPAVPLFTVAIGETTETRDIAIGRITANRVAYEGLPTPVDVTVRSSGIRAGEKILVTLSEGGRELAQEVLTPGAAPEERRITLMYVPTDAGIRRYAIRADVLSGEQTAENNRSAFVVRVLKSALHVLLLAGSPGPDVAVIGQTLREEKEYSVSTLTQRPGGGFFEGPLRQEMLDSADALILAGYPSRSSSGESWRMVVDLLRRRTVPVMFLLGKGTDTEKAAQIASVIPFTYETYSGAEVYVNAMPRDAERAHPLVALGLDDGPGTWTRLPPLYRTAGVAHAKAGTRVLVTAGLPSGTAPDPLLVLQSAGGARSIGIAAYGLWRWRLMVQGDDRTRDFLSAFLSGSLKWLTSPEGAKPLRVRPVKELFVRGEPIELTGEAYDAASQPVENAVVSATLERPEGNLVTELRPLGNGRYEGRFEGMAEGEYRLTASAEAGGATLGRDEAKVIVGGMSIELRDPHPDRALLRALSERTGGLFLLPGEMARLDSALAATPGFAERNVGESSEYRLHHRPVLLGLLLLLFAAEWILRRRAGML